MDAPDPARPEPDVPRRFALVRGVRFRITAVAALAAAVVLTVAGSVLLVVQREQLFDALDASLGRQADDLSSSGLDLSDPPLEIANLAGDDSAVQIVAADGVVLAATANAVDAPPIGAPAAETVIRTTDTLPIEDDEYTVHVATNTDDLRDVMARLRATLWVVVPVATLGLCVVVWWLVGRTLRPVEAIRTEVAAIGAQDLTRRLPRPGTGDEIDRLVATMNEMLGRLAAASEAQHRFIADASHELRSPLSRMRAGLDLARADPTAEPRAVYTELATELRDLTALVDDLLALARADAGSLATTARPVDLDDLLLAEVGGIADHDGVAVDLSGMSAANVTGDPGQLRRMVRNLVDNAARHARSTVSVTLAEDTATGVVELAVTDDGPGIRPEQAERVFDRFVRLDDARTRDAGGTGLGLAIVRDIAGRHGGEVVVDTEHSPGARFVVRLPASP
jgi:signal transduction histidine kinase